MSESEQPLPVGQTALRAPEASMSRVQAAGRQSSPSYTPIRRPSASQCSSAQR
ncbi:MULTISPECIES: hypothetical protein [unclassified Streptomyces]|uniref:hypothetical protein n=1 Tax=unclassified Streptomyces TaxID=2593676 RepID=UPI0036E53E48